MSKPSPHPDRCERCSGTTFSTVGAGFWDGRGSGWFWRVRCAGCAAVWAAYPTHDELDAGQPLRWFEWLPEWGGAEAETGAAPDPRAGRLSGGHSSPRPPGRGA